MLARTENFSAEHVPVRSDIGSSLTRSSTTPSTTKYPLSFQTTPVSYSLICYLLQPERIDPQRAKGYDVRSDVWSLGITLMEVATGRFPYPKWNSVFEQLFQVVQGEPPRLSLVHNGNPFSEEFVNLVNTWLVSHRNRSFVLFSF